MTDRGSSEHEILRQYADVADFVREAASRQTQLFEETKTRPSFYKIALGQVPLQLGEVEFRILTLLASKPYRPFSAHRIAAGVTTERMPVSEEAVEQHIAALREQLGFFRDYVQTVPYMGYRFKA